jgi:hypothetical protein
MKYQRKQATNGRNTIVLFIYSKVTDVTIRMKNMLNSVGLNELLGGSAGPKCWWF